MRGQPGSFLYGLSRKLCRIEVTGAEKLAVLEQPGPAMIIANHSTVVDVVVVVGTLHKLGYTVDGPCEGVCKHHRHLRPVGTSDMWNFAFARRIVEGSGIIPTDQHDGRSAYRAAREALRNGECVLIYPEGDVQVNEDASPRSWRPGAVALAKSTPLPIVFMAHHDTRKLGGGSVQRSILLSLTGVFRRPKIQLVVGEPVMPAELENKSGPEITEYLEARLRQTWAQAKALN